MDKMDILAKDIAAEAKRIFDGFDSFEPVIFTFDDHIGDHIGEPRKTTGGTSLDVSRFQHLPMTANPRVEFNDDTGDVGGITLIADGITMREANQRAEYLNALLEKVIRSSHVRGAILPDCFAAAPEWEQLCHEVPALFNPDFNLWRLGFGFPTIEAQMD